MSVNTNYQPAEATTGYRPLADDAVPAVIFGALWLFGIGSLVAVICGHLALGHIKRSGGSLRGEGLAVTGLVLGYFGLLTTALLVLTLMAAVR